MLNFYHINGDGKIWTLDHLVIKTLIPCQRTISTQKLKLLGEVSGYELYYSLTNTGVVAGSWDEINITNQESSKQDYHLI